MSQNDRYKTQKAKAKSINGDLRSAQITYYGSNTYNSFERKVRAFDVMQRSSTMRLHQTDVARSMLELAVLAPTKALKDAYVEDSIRHAHAAEQNAIGPIEKLKASMHLANLSLMLCVHLDGEHPSVHALRRAQIKLATTLATVPPLHDYSGDRGSLKGVATEAGTLLLLQRYATEEIQSGDYTPVPSLLSQDHTTHKTKYNQPNWDVSIYTGERIDDPTYKLQIKFAPIHEGAYASDIISLSIANLALANPHEVRYGRFVNAAAGAILEPDNPNYITQARLYTESILDIMG